MKKYNLTIEGKKYAVEVDVNDNIANVKVNDKSYTVEIEKEKEPQIAKVAKPTPKPAAAPAQDFYPQTEDSLDDLPF